MLTKKESLSVFCPLMATEGFFFFKCPQRDVSAAVKECIILTPPDQWSLVAHVCNPSTQEAEAKESSGMQSLSGTHNQTLSLKPETKIKQQQNLVFPDLQYYWI